MVFLNPIFHFLFSKTDIQSIYSVSIAIFRSDSTAKRGIYPLLIILRQSSPTVLASSGASIASD